MLLCCCRCVMERQVGVVYDARMCAHEDPVDKRHPERPSRITSIWDALQASGVLERCVRVPARDATAEELACVHTKDHIELMRSLSKRRYGTEGRLALAARYNSVYFNEGSSSSALLAAGSVVEISAQVAEGKLSAGAAIVRPPGHHAEAGEAMGFCLFNNVAVAAKLLSQEGRKVLIVDWDIHHGNGTQNMFWEDPSVLYFSVHRYDFGMFYPSGDGGDYTKTGGGPGYGYNINVPWPHAGFGDGDYLAVWDHVLMPVASQFQPDIVLISGGFDSARGDPLGGCDVTPVGYRMMTKKLMTLAGGKIVLALEGGYNLESISESYLACVQTLVGDLETENIVLPSFESTWAVIDAVRLELSSCWGSLQGEVEKPLHSKASLQGTILIETSEEEDVINGSDEVSERKLVKLLEELALSDGLAPLQHTESDALKGEVSENLTPAAASLVPSVIQEVSSDSTYVWYACYGSNLYLPRLMCHIEGGKIEGAILSSEGLSDKTPPLEDFWLCSSNRLFFGRTWSATWGSGGVAFLHPLESDSSSYLRAYKITLEQFNGLFAAENKVNSSSHCSVSAKDIELLKKGPPFHCLDIFKETWYGTVMYLGEKDGLPILTITCSIDNAARYDCGELPVTAPSDAYHCTILNGLLQKGDLDEEAARAYLGSTSPN